MDINKKFPADISLSLETVRKYLLDHNGKARHVDLAHHFRLVLTTSESRQDLKDILQLITATKTEHGDKYAVLIRSNKQKFQNSVIRRKASRPLSIRKEIARSKIEYSMVAAFAAREYHSDDDDLTSSQTSLTSSLGSDYDYAIDDAPLISISSESNSLLAQIRDSYISRSTDSLDNSSLSTNDDLDEDLDMGEEVTQQEKEWFVAAATGNKQSLIKLLRRNPKLVTNRDFVLGYTALHWAAKLGRSDILDLVMEQGADVHCKSHGGYTPLHVAALSGKDNIITRLIDVHNANIFERDHSGKKPRDLVKETVAPDIQRKLGRLIILSTNWDIETLRRSSAANTGYRGAEVI